MVDLIPKQQRKRLFGQWFFLIASILLLVGVGVGFFVLDRLEKSKQDILANLQDTLVGDTQPQEEALVTELTQYKERIDQFRLAANQRKDFLPVFGFLEESILESVVLETMQADRVSEQVLLTGTADSFFVLEQQRLLWLQDERVQGLDIVSMQLGADGITFNVELVL